MCVCVCVCVCACVCVCVCVCANEENVLFNDALTHFIYDCMASDIIMVKDHSKNLFD